MGNNMKRMQDGYEDATENNEDQEENAGWCMRKKYRPKNGSHAEQL